MNLNNNKLVIFYKKYGLHIEALLILVLLCSIWFMYNKNVNLQTEIKENCGWGEDNYYCFCEKSEAMALKNKALSQINSNEINTSILFEK